MHTYSQSEGGRHALANKAARKQREKQHEGAAPFHEILCHSLGQPRKYSSIEALRNQCCVACSACAYARVQNGEKGDSEKTHEKGIKVVGEACARDQG